MCRAVATLVAVAKLTPNARGTPCPHTSNQVRHNIISHLLWICPNYPRDPTQTRPPDCCDRLMIECVSPQRSGSLPVGVTPHVDEGGI
uniref:Putative secreted protein n=1 Tax=Anopheles marajoara TaxID=58244 RepID=A0A2M4CA78_9DIPT